MRRFPAVLSLALAGTTAAAAAPRVMAAQGYGDEYTAPRTATVDARGARQLAVEGKGGVLRIRGVDGIGEVRVRGTARASRRELLEEIRLVARREGDVVVVRADISDRDYGWGDGNHFRGLDLVLEVPRGIATDVVDGSGEIEIRGVGALDVKDGSGEIDVEDVASARIEDGSGEIRVRDVRGDVRLNDGSGSIDVTRVRGSVIVESDGSGGVDVRDVGGDFTIQEGRGRGVSYRDVRGAVRVPVDRRSRARDLSREIRSDIQRDVQRDIQRDIQRDVEREVERAARERERALERAQRERDRALERAARDRERAYRRSWY